MLRVLSISLCLAVALTLGCKGSTTDEAKGPSGGPGGPAPGTSPTSPGAVAPQAAGDRTDRTTKAAVADPSALTIAVTIDGAPGSWPLKDIARVRAMEVEGDSGEGARNAWSLRQVASTLVSPAARVVSLADASGKVVAIDAVAWADVAKLPLLRVNRRGIVKFHWASPDGEPIEGGDLRGVSKIDLVTR